MIRLMCTLSLALLAAAPAAAMTQQQAPAPSPGRASIADPDAKLDRLASQSERASRLDRYDRSSARSVMDWGSRAGRAGPQMDWRR